MLQIKNSLFSIFKKHYYWIIPFLLLFLVFNNISYGFVFVSIFFIFYVVKDKPLLATLFLILIFCLPLEKDIRSWPITVVPYFGIPSQPGYNIYFSITPKLVFVLITIAIIISRKIKNKNYLNSKISSRNKLLLLFFLFATISSVFSLNPTVTIVGMISLFIPIYYYFFSQIFFANKYYKKLFINYLIFLTTFLVVIGIIQSLKQSFTGIFFENFNYINGSTGMNMTQTGFYTTDGAYKLFRIMGIAAHPTFYASLMALLLPINISVFLKRFTKKIKFNSVQYLYLFNILGTIYCIIQTYSRSSWIAMILVIVLFIFKYKNNKNIKKYIINKLSFIIILAVSLFFILSINSILIRIKSFSEVFTYGNGSGRIEHIRQAVYVFTNYPITGVGINNFTYILDKRLDLKFREFLYPIHNTILLFASEMGIPAAIVFIIFLINSIKIIYLQSKKNIIHFGILLSILTFIINSQFHPLFKDDVSFNFLLIIIAYSEVTYNKKYSKISKAHQ